jgi:hypothetical protein
VWLPESPAWLQEVFATCPHIDELLPDIPVVPPTEVDEGAEGGQVVRWRLSKKVIVSFLLRGGPEPGVELCWWFAPDLRNGFIVVFATILHPVCGVHREVWGKPGAAKDAAIRLGRERFELPCQLAVDAQIAGDDDAGWGMVLHTVEALQPERNGGAPVSTAVAAVC